jgi:hypothetical protein
MSSFEEKIKAEAKSINQIAKIFDKSDKDYSDAEFEKACSKKEWIKLDVVLKAYTESHEEEKKKLQQFSVWLEERARIDEDDFRKKGWNVKAEARAIKDKFEEVLKDATYNK